MEYEIRLEQLGSRPLAVVRRRASSQELSRAVPEACGIVWGVIRQQQVEGAGRHVAVYLDGEINLEVGVELDAPFAGYGEVVGSAPHPVSSPRRPITDIFDDNRPVPCAADPCRQAVPEERDHGERGVRPWRMNEDEETTVKAFIISSDPAL